MGERVSTKTETHSHYRRILCYPEVNCKWDVEIQNEYSRKGIKYLMRRVVLHPCFPGRSTCPVPRNTFVAGFARIQMELRSRAEFLRIQLPRYVAYLPRLHKPIPASPGIVQRRSWFLRGNPTSIIGCSNGGVAEPPSVLSSSAGNRATPIHTSGRSRNASPWKFRNAVAP